MIEQIVANIAANLVLVLMLTLLVTLIYIFTAFTDRHHLLRFFGITDGLPRLRIYMSRMQILASSGFKEVAKGYKGPAISRIEYDAALLACGHLESRLLAYSPRRIRTWLAQRRIAFIAVEPEIDICPEKVEGVIFENLLLIGSSVYNVVSQYYVEEHHSGHFCFEKAYDGEHILRIREGGLRGVQIPGRSYGQELGIIQRIYDRDRKNTVLVCAGLGASATFGCVRYLLENWKPLQIRYGDKEFAICLAFPNQPIDTDSEPVVDPTPIYEFSSGNFALHGWSVNHEGIADRAQQMLVCH